MSNAAVCKNGEELHQFVARSAHWLSDGSVVEVGDVGGFVSAHADVDRDVWVGPGCHVFAGAKVKNGSILLNGVNVRSDVIVDNSRIVGPMEIHGETIVRDVSYRSTVVVC